MTLGDLVWRMEYEMAEFMETGNPVWLEDIIFYWLLGALCYTSIAGVALGFQVSKIIIRESEGERGKTMMYSTLTHEAVNSYGAFGALQLVLEIILWPFAIFAHLAVLAIEVILFFVSFLTVVVCWDWIIGKSVDKFHFYTQPFNCDVAIIERTAKSDIEKPLL